MNERIRELMEEVVSIEVDPDSKMETIYTCGPEDFEAFAELIVRECAKVADEGLAEVTMKGPEWPSYYIKKHFGVVE